MRSPADMKYIQIDITNACPNQCSHCTRFCGHHRRPFFMDLPTFKAAVDSLRGFSRSASVMGGEPLLHPRFPELMEYYRRSVGHDDPGAGLMYPTDNFLKHTLWQITDSHITLSAHLTPTAAKRQHTLFTCVGRPFKKHFELIQDVFGLQYLNDHSYPSRHGTLMVSRHDLGIPDSQWFPLRDACWIQNLWSASITPKGAFFCEVAAALDMLLDGPGGWPVESGWWRRTPRDFKDQLHWCEICGAALSLPWQYANLETDYISPSWETRLRDLPSPKHLAGRTIVFDGRRYAEGAGEITRRFQPYLSDNSKRAKEINELLAPGADIAVILSLAGACPPDEAGRLLDRAAALDPGIKIVSSSAESRRLAAERGLAAFDLDGDDFSALGPRLREWGARDWVLLLRDYVPSAGGLERFRRLVFNPGVLYAGVTDAPGEARRFDFFNLRASSLAAGFIRARLDDYYPATKLQMLDEDFARTIHILVAGPEDARVPRDLVFRPIALAADDFLGDLALMRGLEAEDPDSLFVGLARADFLPVFRLGTWDRTENFCCDRLDAGTLDYYKLDAGQARLALGRGQVYLPHDNLVWRAEMLLPCPEPTPEEASRRLSVAEWLSSLYGPGLLAALRRELARSPLAPYMEDYLSGDRRSPALAFAMRREFWEEFRDLAFPLLEALRPEWDGRTRRPGETLGAVIMALFAARLRDRGDSVREVPFLRVGRLETRLGPLPPPNPEAVCLATAVDEKAGPAARALLASIGAQGDPARIYEVTVLADGLTAESRRELTAEVEKHPHLDLRIIETESFDLPLPPPLPGEEPRKLARRPLLRLFLPLFLPHHRRVLYVEPDSLFERDPAPAFQHDLAGAALGGALDWETLEEHRAANPGRGLPASWERPPYPPNLGEKYLHPDLLLMDLVQWRKLGLPDIIFDLYLEELSPQAFADAVNCGAAGRVTLLEPGWNVPARPRAACRLPDEPRAGTEAPSLRRRCGAAVTDRPA